MKEHLDPKISISILSGLVCLTVLIVASFLLDTARVQYEEQIASAQSALRGKVPKPFSGDFPAFKFDGPSQRQEALNRLGERLPEVAAWYGMSSSELRTLFGRDKSLWMDQNARLFYADDLQPEAGVTPVGSTDSTLGVLYPLDQTFTLHSRPQAKKVIYLDFDGATITNTAWNAWKGISTITAPAWDIDGDPSSFGVVERERIQRIWQQVAEDYSPFDVNVTTEAPPLDRLTKSTSGDEYYGAVALISPISQHFGSVGGLGYIGVFGSAYYQPALIFPERLSNHDKYIAEIISHEVGHNLGLNHDGTTSGSEYYWGHGTWAPIMGAALYASVSQFSSGEYAGANNTQDDLAFIALHGVAVRADDCGATTSAACNLTQGGGLLSGAGVIERRADVDLHKFQAEAGSVSIEVKTHPFASNLNTAVSIVDDRGTVIVSAPPSTSRVVLNTTVTGGTYYLRVQGVGSVDYSDYASLGSYQIIGTVAYSGKLPPLATATALPETGSAPLRVVFSSEGSTDPDGAITSYVWQFGNGTSSLEPNPVMTYNSVGTYAVVLTVTDNDGLTATDSIEVVVANTPPAAVITASPLGGGAPLAVTFSGKGSSDQDGTISSYVWQFGDGASAEGESAQHTFTSPGSYTAKLTVIDNGGIAATAQTIISVSDENIVTAPSGLVSSVGGRTVTLSWNDRAANETEYRVYRWLEEKRKSPNYATIATLPANASTYADTVVSSGTYYYYVEAVNTAAGTKAASSPIKVRVR